MGSGAIASHTGTLKVNILTASLFYCYSAVHRQIYLQVQSNRHICPMFPPTHLPPQMPLGDEQRREDGKWQRAIYDYTNPISYSHMYKRGVFWGRLAACFVPITYIILSVPPSCISYLYMSNSELSLRERGWHTGEESQTLIIFSLLFF